MTPTDTTSPEGTALAVAPIRIPDALPDVLPSDIERQVQLCNTDVPHDIVAAAIDAVAFLKQRARAVDTLLDAVLLEWIKANGPVVIGTKRWVLAVEKSTKCRDNKTTLAAILEATGGDVDATAEYLGSQPFKHGASKKLLSADAFEKCFEVREKEVVNEKGEKTPAPKTVQVFDDAFAR